MNGSLLALSANDKFKILASKSGQQMLSPTRLHINH
jgi:hypothetical protein